MNYHRTISLYIAICLFVAWTASAQSAERKYWELSPYTIRIEIAFSDSLAGNETIERDLVEQLEQRVLATMHPLWSTEINVRQGPEKYELIAGLQSAGKLTPVEGAFTDKQMFLIVDRNLAGYQFTCREWDRSTQLWGPVLRRQVKQNIMLHEECFALLRRTFSPLASIEPDPNDPAQVFLSFKGNELPSRTEEGLLVSPGQVMQPLMIRYDSSGEVVEGGVREVPWTYLTAEQTDSGTWVGKVHSGMKRAFGKRRRGRSRQLAIAVRNPAATSRVRFYARHDQDEGLVGYEVFRRFRDDQESEFLALTDASGSVFVEPAEVDVVTLFLRSDGQLLAKVPVAPGAKPLVEIPIADDTARLRAQAELTAFREQLIDVVARRNILMTRARDRLAAGNLDEARELVAELDDLPGRAKFDQMLVSAERKRSNISSDERVQGRIDKMFSETRKLLGRFLDVRQISELRNEVNAAAKTGTN